AGDLLEAQHLVGLHAQLLRDPLLGPVAPRELLHDLRHAVDAVLSAGAVVPDRRRHAVAEVGARRVGLRDREVASRALADLLARAPDLAAMEAVDRLDALAVSPRHDGLRVAVRED